MTGSSQIQPQFLTKPAFTVVGLLIHTKPKSPAIAQLWDQFVPRIDEIKHAVEPGVSYGVMISDMETLDYMAGNPVEKVNELPTGMNQWDVPANTYAVFEATLATIGQTFDYIYSTWLPNSGYQLVAGPCFERYSATFSPANPGLSIFIPVEKQS